MSANVDGLAASVAPDDDSNDRESVWKLRLAAAILAVHAGLLAWSASVHSPTFDEPGHLTAGIYYWQYGRFDLYCVNPPLVRLAAALPVVLADPQTDWYEYFDSPVARTEFEVGRDFVTANGMNAMRYTVWARWACIPFSLVGGYVCFRWACELFGSVAGILALTLWCVSPTVLGNGALITSDVPAAAAGIAALYVFRGWLLSPGWERAIWTGVVVGFAMLTKTTWIILFPLLPLLWCIARMIASRRSNRRALSSEVGQIAGIGLMALLILNLVYGFEGTFQSLGDYKFRSRLLGGAAVDRNGSANRFSGSWLGRVPVPVPKSFLQGIDLQRRDLQEGTACTFEETSRPDGCWFYYLYALAVKVPLAVWVLAGLSIAGRKGIAIPAVDRVLLFVPAVSLLVLVSANLGRTSFRYLMPLLPLIFIGVSRSAHLALDGGFGRRCLTVAAVAWFVVASLLAYPHSIHYFNELAGGPENAHEVLLEAGQDWGQDLLLLKEWLEEYPDARPIFLACHVGFDPKSIGIDYRVPFRDAASGENAGIPPGWYAISESALFGVSATMTSESGRTELHPRLDEFRSRTPDARIGYSIYLFHVP